MTGCSVSGVRLQRSRVREENTDSESTIGTLENAMEAQFSPTSEVMTLHKIYDEDVIPSL